MNYLIEFKYERVRGQTLTSKVYAKTEGEADLIVEDHLGDETRPRVVSWKIYKLLREGVA